MPYPQSSETLAVRQARTARGREKQLANAAHRAVDDPVVLARAARIVRAALARDRISLADLTPLPRPDDNRSRQALTGLADRERNAGGAS
jgi:hypothetical protein